MKIKTFTPPQTKSIENINNINKLKIIKATQLRTTFVILLMLISFYCLIQ